MFFDVATWPPMLAIHLVNSRQVRRGLCQAVHFDRAWIYMLKQENWSYEGLADFLRMSLPQLRGAFGIRLLQKSANCQLFLNPCVCTSIYTGSNCSMRGNVHCTVDKDKFQILTGADALTVYTFGTGKAKHMFCR